MEGVYLAGHCVRPGVIDCAYYMLVLCWLGIIVTRASSPLEASVLPDEYCRTIVTIHMRNIMNPGRRTSQKDLHPDCLTTPKNFRSRSKSQPNLYPWRKGKVDLCSSYLSVDNTGSSNPSALQRRRKSFSRISRFVGLQMIIPDHWVYHFESLEILKD